MSAVSFGALTDEDEKTVKDALEVLEARVRELQGGQGLDYDDRSIKPMQAVLSTDPSEEQVRAVELGLGELLKREFDLDWVSIELDSGTCPGMNIPMTENVVDPTEFFSSRIKAGKPVNVRLCYVRWSEWIEEHAFD